MAVPKGLGTLDPRKIRFLEVEISWGSQWLSINDGYKYRLAAEGTREQSAKTFRKTLAQSPILGGDYLIHAAPDMVQEQVSVWVHGEDQTTLSENLLTLEEAFSQWDYRIRWTMDEYRETWRCQLAENTMNRGQIFTHNYMAKAGFTVPRYPDLETETLE